MNNPKVASGNAKNERQGGKWRDVFGFTFVVDPGKANSLITGRALGGTWQWVHGSTPLSRPDYVYLSSQRVVGDVVVCVVPNSRLYRLNVRCHGFAAEEV
jgi:hypothetical protein